MSNIKIKLSLSYPPRMPRSYLALPDAPCELFLCNSCLLVFYFPLLYYRHRSFRFRHLLLKSNINKFKLNFIWGFFIFDFYFKCKYLTIRDLEFSPPIGMKSPSWRAISRFFLAWWISEASGIIPPYYYRNESFVFVNKIIQININDQ